MLTAVEVPSSALVLLSGLLTEVKFESSIYSIRFFLHNRLQEYKFFLQELTTALNDVIEV